MSQVKMWNQKWFSLDFIFLNQSQLDMQKVMFKRKKSPIFLDLHLVLDSLSQNLLINQLHNHKNLLIKTSSSIFDLWEKNEFRKSGKKHLSNLVLKLQYFTTNDLISWNFIPLTSSTLNKLRREHLLKRSLRKLLLNF